MTHLQTNRSCTPIQVALSPFQIGRQKKTYTCQGQKQGISNCVDQNGVKVGEVVSQPDGTVIVKKTLTKGVDIPIAKSKVTRNKDGKAVATVNDGLLSVEAGNYRERDCMSGKGMHVVIWLIAQLGYFLCTTQACTLLYVCRLW